MTMQQTRQNANGWWIMLQAAQSHVSPWGKNTPFTYRSRKCRFGQNLQKLPWKTGWEAQHLTEILTPSSQWMWKALLGITTRCQRWEWGESKGGRAARPDIREQELNDSHWFWYRLLSYVFIVTVPLLPLCIVPTYGEGIDITVVLLLVVF